MEAKKFIKENAVGKDFLADWYLNSVYDEDQPVWTDQYLNELVGDFYLIPKEAVSYLPDPAKSDDEASDDFEHLEISEELIRKGLDRGSIKLVNGNDLGYVSAEIGDWWFWFETDSELESLPVQEYRQRVSMDEIVKKIHTAINDEPIKGENEDDSTEFLYYKSLLDQLEDIQEAYIYVSEEETNYIRELLTREPKDKSECIGEDFKYSKDVTFADGTYAYVDICGVYYLEGESNLPWTQAVLYRDGAEIFFTEPESDFFGDWELWDHEDRKYIVHVVVAEEPKEAPKLTAKYTGAFTPKIDMIRKGVEHGFVSIGNDICLGGCIRVGEHLFPTYGVISYSAESIQAYFTEHPIKANKNAGTTFWEAEFCRDLFMGRWRPSMGGNGKYRVIYQGEEIPSLATDDLNLAIRQVHVLQEAVVADDNGETIYSQDISGEEWNFNHPDYAVNLFYTSSRSELFAEAEILSKTLKEAGVSLKTLEKEIRARFNAWWNDPEVLPEYNLAKLVDVRTLWCAEK